MLRRTFAWKTEVLTITQRPRPNRPLNHPQSEVKKYVSSFGSIRSETVIWGGSRPCSCGRKPDFRCALHRWLLSGTFRTCAGAAFAHAEKLRICSMAVAASQLMSPKRSLNPATRRHIQAALSLRLDHQSRRGTKTLYAAAAQTEAYRGSFSCFVSAFARPDITCSIFKKLVFFESVTSSIYKARLTSI